MRDDDFKLPKAGDPHYGLLLNIRERLGRNQLLAGIDSFDKRIAEHEAWIVEPTTKPGVSGHAADDIARWKTIKWPRDVARLKVQRAIYVAVLEEKEDGSRSGGS